MENLTPQHKYRFRVRAANKIGPSDPGEMGGDDILMRDPWGECGGNSIDILLARALARELAPVLARVSCWKVCKYKVLKWTENWPNFWPEFWPEIFKVY